MICAHYSNQLNCNAESNREWHKNLQDINIKFRPQLYNYCILIDTVVTNPLWVCLALFPKYYTYLATARDLNLYVET